MAIGAVISTSLSPLELVLQSIQEEATESLTDTQMEARDGDSPAEPKLQLMEGGQAPETTFNAYQPPPPPGTFLNVKA